MAEPHMEYNLYHTCGSVNSYTIATVNFSDPTASLAVYPQAVFNHKEATPMLAPMGNSSQNVEEKLDVLKQHLGKAETGEYAPDFGRFLIRTGKDGKLIKIPIDFWEVKPLCVVTLDVPWWSPVYQEAADKIMLKHLPQVYNTAMAAFAQYSDLDKISAVLIVGIYFSRFEWMRPAPPAREPTRQRPPVTPVPGGSLDANAHFNTRVQQLLVHLAEEVVHIPTVISWNQPISKDATHPTLRLKCFTLSDPFTQAIYSPVNRVATRHNMTVTFQPSWFDAWKGANVQGPPQKVGVFTPLCFAHVRLMKHLNRRTE